jgi:hypothetical protein
MGYLLMHQSASMCMTSPPYWGLRSYLDDDDPLKAHELGSEPTPEEYVASMVAVFREVRRVLHPSGTVWLNIGDSYSSGDRDGHGIITSTKQKTNNHAANTLRPRMPLGLKPKDLCMIPARLALALQADGWWLRSEIIWAKPNPMPESVLDRPTRAHEYIFLLSNGERYFYDADAVRESYAETSIGRYETSMQSTAPTGRQPGGDIERKRREERIRDPNPLGRNRRTVWGSVNPILCRGALRDIPARADRAVHPGRVSRWRHSTGSIRRRWHHRLGRGSARPQRNPDRAKPRVRGDGPPPDRARLPALCKRDWRALYGH